MENNANLEAFTPLELMLRWNHYCDAHGREGDCILLNEEQTYQEAFSGRDEALKEIINCHDPNFQENTGYLVPLWGKDEKYIGMRYVPFDAIGNYIDLSLIGLE